MNPIENNLLVRTCKICFKRKQILGGSGEAFFQEPYQCISCCFKSVQEVVQQRPKSSSKNNENKVDAKCKPSKNTSSGTRNIIQSKVKVVKSENDNPGNTTQPVKKKSNLRTKAVKLKDSMRLSRI